MERLFPFGRRRFTVGGLVLGAWGLVRELVGARPKEDNNKLIVQLQ